MIHSKWIYNIYEIDFAIKRKWNNYKERIYYQKVLIDAENQGIKYSRNKKFIYKYERNYILIFSLQYY